MSFVLGTSGRAAAITAKYYGLGANSQDEHSNKVAKFRTNISDELKYGKFGSKSTHKRFENMDYAFDEETRLWRPASQVKSASGIGQLSPGMISKLDQMTARSVDDSFDARSMSSAGSMNNLSRIQRRLRAPRIDTSTEAKRSASEADFYSPSRFSVPNTRDEAKSLLRGIGGFVDELEEAEDVHEFVIPYDEIAEQLNTAETAQQLSTSETDPQLSIESQTFFDEVLSMYGTQVSSTEVQTPSNPEGNVEGRQLVDEVLAMYGVEPRPIQPGDAAIEPASGAVIEPEIETVSTSSAPTVVSNEPSASAKKSKKKKNKKKKASSDKVDEEESDNSNAPVSPQSAIESILAGTGPVPVIEENSGIQRVSGPVDANASSEVPAELVAETSSEVQPQSVVPIAEVQPEPVVSSEVQSGSTNVPIQITENVPIQITDNVSVSQLIQVFEAISVINDDDASVGMDSRMSMNAFPSTTSLHEDEHARYSVDMDKIPVQLQMALYDHRVESDSEAEVSKHSQVVPVVEDSTPRPRIKFADHASEFDAAEVVPEDLFAEFQQVDSPVGSSAPTTRPQSLHFDRIYNYQSSVDVLAGLQDFDDEQSNVIHTDAGHMETTDVYRDAGFDELSGVNSIYEPHKHQKENGEVEKEGEDGELEGEGDGELEKEGEDAKESEVEDLSVNQVDSPISIKVEDEKKDDDEYEIIEKDEEIEIGAYLQGLVDQVSASQTSEGERQEENNSPLKIEVESDGYDAGSSSSSYSSSSSSYSSSSSESESDSESEADDDRFWRARRDLPTPSKEEEFGRRVHPIRPAEQVEQEACEPLDSSSTTANASRAPEKDIAFKELNDSESGASYSWLVYSTGAACIFILLAALIYKKMTAASRLTRSI